MLAFESPKSLVSFVVGLSLRNYCFVLQEMELKIVHTSLLSEIKVFTYVDLITSVAGVPSFLFIISQFLMKYFESFYSDLQITQPFETDSSITDKDFGFWQ